MNYTNANDKLFNIEENEPDWKKEWRDMPEFTQTKKEKPYAQITIRFGCKEDLDDFSKLINQKITKKTKAIWHPCIVRGLNANKIYIYEP